MARKHANYHEIRDKMEPGDIVAFSGKGDFSEMIKWATRSDVSHIAVVMQTKLLIDDKPQDGIFNEIIESTTLNGFSGVSVNRISGRIEQYDGDVWWLPLSKGVKKKLDRQKLFDFLLHQEGKPYDMPQAIKSALDALDRVPLLERATHNIEDFSKFFCSELAAAALEEAGVIKKINASEVTPIDLCMFNIYQKDYYQLKGVGQDIKGFNSLQPDGWGM